MIVDVLRATSTITTALAAGVTEVYPVGTLDECAALGREHGCLTAAERDGVAERRVVHPAAHPMQRGKNPLRTGRSAKLGKARRLTHQGCVRPMHWPGRPAWARTARVRGHEAW